MMHVGCQHGMEDDPSRSVASCGGRCSFKPWLTLLDDHYRFQSKFGRSGRQREASKERRVKRDQRHIANI